MFFRRAWLITRGLTYEAVRAHDGPLTVEEFLEYETALALLAEAESKEGRERIRTRVDAHTAIDAETDQAIELGVLADADDGDDERAPWEADAEHTAVGRMGVSSRVTGQPGAARRVLLDGARLGDAVFRDPETLLQLLPPDDPRAVYVRAGGRLDAWGDPMTIEHAATIGHAPRKTRDDVPTSLDMERRILPREEAQRHSEMPAQTTQVYDPMLGPPPSVFASPRPSSADGKSHGFSSRLSPGV